MPGRTRPLFGLRRDFSWAFFAAPIATAPSGFRADIAPLAPWSCPLRGVAATAASSEACTAPTLKSSGNSNERKSASARSSFTIFAVSVPFFLNQPAAPPPPSQGHGALGGNSTARRDFYRAEPTGGRRGYRSRRLRSSTARSSGLVLSLAAMLPAGVPAALVLFSACFFASRAAKTSCGETSFATTAQMRARSRCCRGCSQALLALECLYSTRGEHTPIALVVVVNLASVVRHEDRVAAVVSWTGGCRSRAAARRATARIGEGPGKSCILNLPSSLIRPASVVTTESNHRDLKTSTDTAVPTTRPRTPRPRPGPPRCRPSASAGRRPGLNRPRSGPGERLQHTTPRARRPLSAL